MIGRSLFVILELIFFNIPTTGPAVFTGVHQHGLTQETDPSLQRKIEENEKLMQELKNVTNATNVTGVANANVNAGTPEQDITDNAQMERASITTEPTDELTCEELDAAKEKDSVVLMDRDFERILAELENEDWYHGCLPFEDIVGLLGENGEFLLRGLEAKEDRNTMVGLTVRWKGKVLDFPVHCVSQKSGHNFTVDGVNSSSNIIDLVKFHQKSQIPVNADVLLIRPVSKQQWELTKDKVHLLKRIGAGQFGEIWEGTLHESPRVPPIIVAVKVTKVRDENKEKVTEMYREARLMRQYKHKNVVAFYGVVQERPDSAMIVMELVSGGSLKDYIRSTKEIPVKEKIHYGIDVAVGLVYLHTKGCMHRDVACRNCLIDTKHKTVKISDFGMSKVAERYDIPKTEKLPIRWQAPEVVIYRVYTAKSDVYSYGITLWEIFHNAEIPFKGIDNQSIRLKILNPKFRPEIGKDVPVAAAKVMRACWRNNPEKRPPMEKAARYLIHAPPKLLQPWQNVCKSIKEVSLIRTTKSTSERKSHGQRRQRQSKNEYIRKAIDRRIQSANSTIYKGLEKTQNMLWTSKR